MTLQQLTYFLAAAQHGSFTAAADVLRLARPSVSEQIAGLEAELADFNRNGTGDAFTAVVGPSQGGAQVTATLSFYRGSGATPVTLTFEPAA